MKRTITAVACAAVSVAVMLVPAPPHATPTAATPADGLAQRCALTVVGVNPDGSFETTPMVCRTVEHETADARNSADRIVTAAPVLARHYSGYNRTGSVLIVNGATCSGGYLNLPALWVNRIASTYSNCNVTHHASYFQTGASEVVWAPGGNLSTLAYASASTTYW